MNLVMKIITKPVYLLSPIVDAAVETCFMQSICHHNQLGSEIRLLQRNGFKKTFIFLSLTPFRENKKAKKENL